MGCTCTKGIYNYFNDFFNMSNSGVRSYRDIIVVTRTVKRITNNA